ncbi:MAG TPA: tyrosine-type recombinase/integrase [Candidatus Caccovivens faecavium]|nr:tyrosine-type recombinase/integrase [Candidatus Caccovivens faecavium]
MNKGSLQVNHGTYYVVVNYKDEFGKPKQKWISTGLRERGNKTKANAKMKEILRNFNLANEVTKFKKEEDILFTDFLNSYLDIKKEQIEPVTINMYNKLSEVIIKYFKNMKLKLKDLKPFHIEGFYKSQYERGLSSNSVVKYHILIRECLQYAFVNDLVVSNVADKVKRPKVNKFKASFYSIEEIEKLFEVIKEHECRLPIMLTAMYGFRRSEVIGLKWEAIDFDKKLISVQHKVIETKIDGKIELYKSDKLKNETSNRILPLLPQAENLLLEKKRQIENNKTMLGKQYDNQYLDYVCVDNMGRLIRPGRLTHSFCKILKQNNLKHIRFHDLRHSCASIMLANGVPMKQIQEWLGHADFGTTANIYSHLNYSSKLNSANTISNVFDFSKQEVQENMKVKSQKEIELEKEVEELKQKLAEQEEVDDKYGKWKQERKRKQKDFEM